MKTTQHYIFIDTSELKGNNFLFDHPDLRSLAGYGQTGLVTCISTEITDQEITDHILARVKEAITAAFSGKGSILKNDIAYKVLETRNYTDAVFKRYQAFKRITNTQILSVDAVSPSSVIELYRNTSPPFSNRKKNEFPDAFSLIALDKWCIDNDAVIHVVSRDPDMKDYCSVSRYLTYHSSVSKLLVALDLEQLEPSDVTEDLAESLRKGRELIIARQRKEAEQSRRFAELEKQRWLDQKQRLEARATLEIRLRRVIENAFSSSQNDLDSNRAYLGDFTFTIPEIEEALNKEVRETIIINENSLSFSDLLEEIDRHKIDLVLRSKGAYHPRSNLSSELTEAIEKYNKRLCVWVVGRQKLGNAAYFNTSWRMEAKFYCSWFWFLFKEPQDEQIQLRSGEYISDLKKYKNSVLSRVRLGYNHPVYHRLLSELKTLYLKYGHLTEKIFEEQQVFVVRKAA